jgi:GAF domain-containing protein
MNRRPDSQTIGQVDSLLAREQRLAETFVELADTLVEDLDLIEFLYTLVERCVELLDVSAVGLMFGDDQGRLRVAASSSEETRLLELFQLQNNEGPCLECYRSGEPVESSDMAEAATRWPLFAPEAVRAGFRTVHALPMRLRERTVGSLNLFHVRPAALPPAATRIAQSLIDVATIGLIQVESGHHSEVLLDQLQRALVARVVIEQAKGVLAERRDITPAVAFAVMRAHARANDLKLTDLAYAVIDGDPLSATVHGAHDPARRA